MKKFISILCTFLFLTGIISILTACNIKTDSSEPEAKQYSVRFYNGTDLISSVETSGNEVIDTPNLLPLPSILLSAAGIWIKTSGSRILPEKSMNKNL